MVSKYRDSNILRHFSGVVFKVYSLNGVEYALRPLTGSVCPPIPLMYFDDFLKEAFPPFGYQWRSHRRKGGETIVTFISSVNRSPHSPQSAFL